MPDDQMIEEVYAADCAEPMVPIAFTYYGRQDRPTHVVTPDDLRTPGKKKTLCSRGKHYDLGTPWYAPVRQVDCQRCLRALEAKSYV